MTSQPPASANAATNLSQPFLLAPLQSSTSSNAPITPSKARKQAHAQRTRLLALSKHLMTRLQYANFKVEHGWSKQSLSEVENLYYRQNQTETSNATSSAATATAAARKSTSTSPNNNNNNNSSSSNNNSNSKPPTTPSVAATQSQVGVGSRLFRDAAVKKIEIEGGDVFGGYGLATPPASACSMSGATSYLTSKRGRSTSSTPISPPNTSANSSASRTGDAHKPSPNNNGSINGASNAPRSVQAASSTNAAAGGAMSYADFWSRVGSSTVSTAVVSRSSTSPSKKRSADNVAAESIGASCAASERPVAAAAGAATIASPNKRVRMELGADRSASSSPVKAALSERGPSFAASSIHRH
ncbi:uncharacterized protein UMAG_04016 [Mycosarcoma maydis]|uniref:Uncharacterized protein n=1 Tax=Mycosarcoma maydis TaxID=5270 RepID=A0A0D1DWG3_MYCMD|nr:uncharacterized protein UMAG_04016 [Ustilago maydis 521]KIS67971.1 hypothetical protein UMAG_04016 [Ustilago maydis 521]|eukprot:XP_011390466.1 hypothetical protein UMAG_04016 [Ustilago maydis 521]